MSVSSPPPSPLRPALNNTTNVEFSSQKDAPPTLSLLTPPSDSKRPASGNWVLGPRKRVKIQHERHASQESSDDNDSDLDATTQCARRHNVFGIRDAWMTAGPSHRSRLAALPTRPVLQAFVSSNKSDVYKCYSMHHASSYLSPPYACAYSHGAKRGDGSLLAVSTEQGAVHLLNTAKRQEWDVEPQRVVFQRHENGIFDVQWSPSDGMVATASADKSVCITKLRPPGTEPLERLSHHKSTLKCVAWDPTRCDSVLCTGSRDGMICVWDLRVGENGGQDRTPVMVIPKAHETGRPPGRKGKLAAPPARGVTSLLFPPHDPNALISSGSYDGILRQWDIRYLDAKRHKTRQAISPKSVSSPLSVSSADPTTYNGTRRARGITSLVYGSGASSGLLFALSTDSRIHTYDAPTLGPLSGWADAPAADRWSYGHDGMHTNSFYVRLAGSPCGRWLASGGSAGGCVYLFDVTARRGGDARGRGVELRGQKGEVGAVDWAPSGLAACADDGTVRIWREDLEVYRQCQDDPEERKWGWSWAVGER